MVKWRNRVIIMLSIFRIFPSLSTNFVVHFVEEEAPRPSPPTRTSASRVSEWKAKYSPQKEEQTYKPVATWRAEQVGE